MKLEEEKAAPHYSTDFSVSGMPVTEQALRMLQWGRERIVTSHLKNRYLFGLGMSIVELFH